MLLGDFYTILGTETFPDEPGHFRATLGLNPAHPIFEGHFPGNPVVPGVCQVQMIRETVEHHQKIHGMLANSSNIKFLNMIVPSAHLEILADFRIRETGPGEYSIDATLADGELIFIKFKGILCTKSN